MTNLAAKLKSMGIDVSESFLEQFIMNSLLSLASSRWIITPLKKNRTNMKLMPCWFKRKGLNKMKDHSLHLTFHDGANNSKAKPGEKNK